MITTQIFNDWANVGNYIANFEVTANLLNNIILAQEEKQLNLKDAFSKGQLASKFWIANYIKDDIIKDFRVIDIVVCGGWYGTMGAALFSTLRDSVVDVSVMSIDKDPKCGPIGNIINSENYDDGSYTSLDFDIYDYDYQYQDMVINTSCEHIPDVNRWLHLIPEGTHVIMQSNNLKEGDGHLNCVSNPLDILDGFTPTEIVSQGEMKFPTYSRFMIHIIR